MKLFGIAWAALFFFVCVQTLTTGLRLHPLSPSGNPVNAPVPIAYTVDDVMICLYLDTGTQMELT